MALRAFLLLAAFLCVTGSSIAQDAACKVREIPVGVISVNGDVFRGLAAEDFAGHTQKRPVTVKSLTYDDGPRRVLIVVDATRKLSPDSRKAEVEMVQSIMAVARPEDTFGLMAARGPGQDVKFTADHAALLQGLEQTGENKRGKDSGVLDTVMVGIEWFGAPQSGDSIIVIAADLEGNHKTTPKQVAKALEDNHIRMFGLALGPVQTQSSVAGGSMTSTTSQGLAWTEPVVGTILYNTGDEHFYPLTVNSGGLVISAMNGDAHRNYKITDAAVLQNVRQKARAITKMIMAYYKMQIEPPQTGRPEGWSLNINEGIQNNSRQMFLLYPHELGPC